MRGSGFTEGISGCRNALAAWGGGASIKTLLRANTLSQEPRRRVRLCPLLTKVNYSRAYGLDFIQLVHPIAKDSFKGWKKSGEKNGHYFYLLMVEKQCW